MATRGPKPYRPDCGMLMPYHLIAERLRMSPRTVKSDVTRALGKLKSAPEVYSLLIQASDARRLPRHFWQRCCSAECNRRLVAHYGEVQS